ncbi:MAG: hypothetical protein JO161_03885 [Planctomycetaceae bacterium]|nr:hypothetical protein [Planctomycetaceae bacterium]
MPGIRKAMHHRSHLGLDKCSARRSRLGLDEYPDQGLKPIEHFHVAKELRRQLLLFENCHREVFPQWIRKEAIPRPPARALQIDDSNFAVGCLQVDFESV